MKALGIIRSNGLELVDVEIRGNAVFPHTCPGGLSIACNDCAFSVSAGAALGNDDVALPASAPTKSRNVPFLICTWYERNRTTA